MIMSNKKFTNFSQLFNRLETIKEKLFLTWDGLAEKMECDRSLFFQVKGGNCGLSGKNLKKLQDLEWSAGIVPPPVPHAVSSDQAAAIIASQEPQKKTITKLRGQVKTLQLQINAIAATIDELA